MKLGLFYEWPNPEIGDWKRLFDQSIEQVQLAEEQGFDFVLIAEHHFSNYGMSPAPLLQALALAKSTQRIRIATAVLVLPVWQPLRLAEEIAVLDNLSDGRFICGIGRGYQPHEFARFGVTNDDSRGRFSECLDVLLKAWTCDTSFTYDGEFVKIPNDVVVWPKPLQKPHPPIWVAGTSSETLRLCAERGFGALTSGFAGPARVGESVAELRRYRVEAGRSDDAWELGAQTICLAGEDDASAKAAMPHARWQLRAMRALNRRDVENGRVQTAAYEGEADEAGLWEALYYGGPERVTAKYVALAEAGATFASCWMMVGGIEHERIMRSIRLMGEHVIPAVRDVRPAVLT